MSPFHLSHKQSKSGVPTENRNRKEMQAVMHACAQSLRSLEISSVDLDGEVLTALCNGQQGSNPPRLRRFVMAMRRADTGEVHAAINNHAAPMSPLRIRKHLERQLPSNEVDVQQAWLKPLEEAGPATCGISMSSALQGSAHASAAGPQQAQSGAHGSAGGFVGGSAGDGARGSAGGSASGLAPKRTYHDSADHATSPAVSSSGPAGQPTQQQRHPRQDVAAAHAASHIVRDASGTSHGHAAPNAVVGTLSLRNGGMSEPHADSCGHRDCHDAGSSGAIDGPTPRKHVRRELEREQTVPEHRPEQVCLCRIQYWLLSRCPYRSRRIRASVQCAFVQQYHAGSDYAV